MGSTRVLPSNEEEEAWVPCWTGGLERESEPPGFQLLLCHLICDLGHLLNLSVPYFLPVSVGVIIVPAS